MRFLILSDCARFAEKLVVEILCKASFGVGCTSLNDVEWSVEKASFTTFWERTFETSFGAALRAGVWHSGGWNEAMK